MGPTLDRPGLGARLVSCPLCLKSAYPGVLALLIYGWGQAFYSSVACEDVLPEGRGAWREVKEVTMGEEDTVALSEVAVAFVDPMED